MLYGSIFMLFVLLAIAGRKKEVPDSGGEDYSAQDKSGIERCFYRMALLLYEWWPLRRRKNPLVSEYLARLHPGQAPPLLRQKYEVERIKLCLIVVFAGNMAAWFLWMSAAGESALSEGMYLLRDEQGQSSKEVNLVAKSSKGEKVQMRLTVQAKGYSEEEQQILYEEMLRELQEEALGENPSWNAISKPLVLTDTFSSYPFILSWHSSNPMFLSSSGKIAVWEDVAQLSEQTALVELTVRVSGKNFEREYSFYAKVCPEKEQKTFSQAVTETLETLEQETAMEDKILLPEEIEGEKIVWSEQREDKSRTIFFLGLAGAVAVFWMQGREPEKALVKKQHLMEREYPAIISKLTLYLGAGMNIKGAWERIAESAEVKNANPVYGEMRFTCREMESGITETEAYTRFGKRARQQCYVRFTTLLVQNLKKGNAALLLLLHQETLSAIEEHASRIKRAGEETATKLLLPMVMLMGMVMILIMVPAFMNM